MNKKLIGIIIILGGVLILIAIVYFIFFNSELIDNTINKVGKEAGQEEIKKFEAEGGTGEQTGLKPPVKKIFIPEGDRKEEKISISPEERSKDDLMRLAASFAERFGSYSNQSNFSNIVDLKIFMSRRMQEWVDNYIASRRGQKIDSSVYYGISTKAVTQAINEYDDYGGQVIILVKTRRREATGSTDDTDNIFNQEILVEFIKENNAWKIDNAIWQPA